MSGRIQVFSENFLRGLMDTVDPTGMEFPGYSEFQNIRAGRGARRRSGSVRVATTAVPENTALDLSGSGQYLSVPARSGFHDMGLVFTVDFLFKPDNVTGPEYLVGWNHATDAPFTMYVEGGYLKATVKDSASGSLALVGTTTIVNGTTYHGRLVRDRGTATLYLDGVQEATDSATLGAGLRCKAPGGSLLFGANGATPSGVFNGVIDNSVALSIANTNFLHMWQRWPLSMARSVLWDYHFTLDSNNRLPDLSPNLNTGSRTGVPTSTTALCVQTATVQAIAGYVGLDARQRVLALVGGVPFIEVV